MAHHAAGWIQRRHHPILKAAWPDGKLAIEYETAARYLKRLLLSQPMNLTARVNGSLPLHRTSQMGRKRTLSEWPRRIPHDFGESSNFVAVSELGPQGLISERGGFPLPAPLGARPIAHAATKTT